MNSGALAELIQKVLSTGLDGQALSDNDELKRLASEIEKLPEYQHVHGKKFQVPGGYNTVSSERVARQVVSRAREEGVDSAIDALARFLAQQETPGRIVMLISSIELESTAMLGSGVEIFPVDALQSNTYSILKEDIYSKFENIPQDLSANKPSAALLLSHVVRPAFDDEFTADDRYVEALQTLEDARRCFTFFGPSTPMTVAHWWEGELDPLHFGFYGIFGSQGIELVGQGHSHRMTDAELDKYRAYWGAFGKLPLKQQRVLRVVLDRLNRALRRWGSVDMAIELGIAMEAFFLSDLDETTELSYRLRLRSAWWLGADKKARRELLQWAGVVYGCRSRAVHTGYLAERLGEPAKYRGQDTRVFLRAACQRVLEAVALALERGGMPDWSSLVLGD